MVSKDTFYSLKHTEENSNDYYEHMARLENRKYERSLLERKLDIIFDAYAKASDKKIGTQKLNSCLRSFPSGSDAFQRVIISMSEQEVHSFCELEPQKRSQLVRKYL